jgi:hypothetical protein
MLFQNATKDLRSLPAQYQQDLIPQDIRVI